VTSEVPATKASAVTYLRLYADDDGESHFALRPLAGDADPEATGWESLDEGAASGYSLRVVPPGWTRDWGSAKERILAVYIAGVGLVESSDGDRREVRPGVFLLAEDTTGRGHRAEVTGDEPLVVLHVVLPSPVAG
jgi:hypothetical protein